jgi:hypothetical protein
MSQQLEVRDVPFVELIRRGALEPMIGNEIKASQAWTSAECTIGGCIQGNLVVEIFKLEEGDTIPSLNVLVPPEQVQTKVLVQRHQ